MRHLTPCIYLLAFWIGLVAGAAPTSRPIVINDAKALNKLPNDLRDAIVFVGPGRYDFTPKRADWQRVLMQATDCNKPPVLVIKKQDADRWAFTLSSKTKQVEWRDIGVEMPSLRGGYVNCYGGDSIWITRPRLNQGNLFWGHGGGDVHIEVGRDGLQGSAKKYIVCNFDAPLDLLDVRGGVYRQGKEEAAIRTMQVRRAEFRWIKVIPYIQENGQPWKQSFQGRSGESILVEDSDVGVAELGFIKQPGVKNVAPLKLVQMHRVKISRLSFSFDYGKVYRDGKRIR